MVSSHSPWARWFRKGTRTALKACWLSLETKTASLTGKVMIKFQTKEWMELHFEINGAVARALDGIMVYHGYKKIRLCFNINIEFG